MACAALDWNENRARECLKILSTKPSQGSIRERPAYKNILSQKTYQWENDVWQLLRDLGRKEVQYSAGTSINEIATPIKETNITEIDTPIEISSKRLVGARNTHKCESQNNYSALGLKIFGTLCELRFGYLNHQTY